MGNTQAITSSELKKSSSAKTIGDDNKPSSTSFKNNSTNNEKPMRERLRYGVCAVKISSVATAQRRNSERQNSYVVTPKGAILHGSQCNPQLIQRALVTSGHPILPPTEIPLGDSRAHKLLVVYSNGWHAIPSPEIFSRHSGTCVVLGDRTAVNPPHKIKLGDCFRLGSVGVVVSEIRYKDEDEQRLDSKTLQYLKDEALTLEVGDELATLAVDEGDQYHDDHGPITEGKSNEIDKVENESGVDTNSVKSVDPNGGIGGGEKFICYMCYETHDTQEDPLVAPCECKGDTRYLHVQCLQKWYQSSVCGPQSQVIRTTGNGAPACKICGTAYKTAFKRADGKRANLLELESSRPYISLVVVTRHDTNAALFNTKFRLNFGRLPNSNPDQQFQDILDNPNELLIGRSSSCNMVLDYRTVSTVHAKINYENGGFYIQDKKSSNGTMMYLQEAFPLSFSHPCRLRMGRTTITLQPKRSITATLRDAFTRSSTRNINDECGSYLNPAQFQTLMASTNNNGSSGGILSNRTASGAAFVATLGQSLSSLSRVGSTQEQITLAEMNKNFSSRPIVLEVLNDGTKFNSSRMHETKLNSFTISLNDAGNNNDGTDGAKNLTGRYNYESFHELSLHNRTMRQPLTLSQAQRIDNVQGHSFKLMPLKGSDDLNTSTEQICSSPKIGILLKSSAAEISENETQFLPKLQRDSLNGLVYYSTTDAKHDPAAGDDGQTLSCIASRAAPADIFAPQRFSPSSRKDKDKESIFFSK